MNKSPQNIFRSPIPGDDSDILLDFHNLILNVYQRLIEKYEPMRDRHVTSQIEMNMLKSTTERIVTSILHPTLSYSKDFCCKYEVISSKVKMFSNQKPQILTVRILAKEICISEPGATTSRKKKANTTYNLDQQIRTIIPEPELKKVTIHLKSWASFLKFNTREFTFKSIRDLAEFCLAVSLIAPHTIPPTVLDFTAHEEVVVYNVMMVHGAIHKKRQLVINITEGTIGRRFTSTDSKLYKVLTITPDVKCLPHKDDQKRLHVIFYPPKNCVSRSPDKSESKSPKQTNSSPKSEYDLIFNNPIEREYFCATIRAVSWGIDRDVLEASGDTYGDTLSVYTATFNFGGKTPKDKHKSQLHRWIPVECKSNPKWIETILQHIGNRIPWANFDTTYIKRRQSEEYKQVRYCEKCKNVLYCDDGVDPPPVDFSFLNHRSNTIESTSSKKHQLGRHPYNHSKSFSSNGGSSMSSASSTMSSSFHQQYHTNYNNHNNSDEALDSAVTNSMLKMAAYDDYDDDNGRIETSGYYEIDSSKVTMISDVFGNDNDDDMDVIEEEDTTNANDITSVTEDTEEANRLIDVFQSSHKTSSSTAPPVSSGEEEHTLPVPNVPQKRRFCASCAAVVCPTCCFHEAFELNIQERVFVCTDCFNSRFETELPQPRNSDCHVCHNALQASDAACLCCGFIVCESCIANIPIIEVSTCKTVVSRVCQKCVNTSPRITLENNCVGRFPVYNNAPSILSILPPCGGASCGSIEPLNTDYVNHCAACLKPRCSRCCVVEVYDLNSRRRKRVCRTCYKKSELIERLDTSNPKNNNHKTNNNIINSNRTGGDVSYTISSSSQSTPAIDGSDTLPVEPPPVLQLPTANTLSSVSSPLHKRNSTYKPIIASDVLLSSDSLHKSSSRVQDILRNDSNNYTVLSTVTMWDIHLFIFVKKDVAQYITDIKTDTLKTGIAGVLGNKGSVASGFRYRQHTRIAFLGSHFAARSTRIAQRNADYRTNMQSINLGQSHPQLSFLSTYHHVFWSGDFNYRVDRGNCGTLTEFNECQKLIYSQDYRDILRTDQLRREMQAGRVFYQFVENEIDFAPTYRMNKGGVGYNNKRDQNASWCDRIVRYSLPGYIHDVTNYTYDAPHNVNTSDHRPVLAVFGLKTRLPFITLQEVKADQMVKIWFSNLRFIAEPPSNNDWIVDTDKLSTLLISDMCELLFILVKVVSGGTYDEELIEALTHACDAKFMFTLIIRLAEDHIHSAEAPGDVLESHAFVTRLVNAYSVRMGVQFLKTTALPDMLYRYCANTKDLNFMGEKNSQKTTSYKPSNHASVVQIYLNGADEILSFVHSLLQSLPLSITVLLARMIEIFKLRFPFVAPFKAEEFITNSVMYNGLIVNIISDPSRYNLLQRLTSKSEQVTLKLLSELIFRCTTNQVYKQKQYLGFNQFIKLGATRIRVSSKSLIQQVPKELVQIPLKSLVLKLDDFMKCVSIVSTTLSKDSALHCLYNHIRQNMGKLEHHFNLHGQSSVGSQLPSTGGLTESKRSGTGSEIWNKVKVLVEPPRSKKPSKKKKKNTNQGQKRSSVSNMKAASSSSSRKGFQTRHSIMSFTNSKGNASLNIAALNNMQRSKSFDQITPMTTMDNLNRMSKLTLSVLSPVFTNPGGAVTSSVANPMNDFSRFHEMIHNDSTGSVAVAAWEWDNHALDCLFPVVQDLTWLTNQHVTLYISAVNTIGGSGSITAQGSIWLGCSNLESLDKSLHPAKGGGEGHFSVNMTSNGIQVGVLHGSVSILPLKEKAINPRTKLKTVESTFETLAASTSSSTAEEVLDARTTTPSSNSIPSSSSIMVPPVPVSEGTAFTSGIVRDCKVGDTDTDTDTDDELLSFHSNNRGNNKLSPKNKVNAMNADRTREITKNHMYSSTKRTF